MKRVLFVSVALCLAVAIMGTAGTKRIVDFSGTIVDTLRNADRDTLVERQINTYPFGNAAMGQRFHNLIGSVTFYNASSAGGASAGGVGNVDTAIVFIIGTFGNYRDTLSIDTVYPTAAGASMYFKHLDELGGSGTISIYGDSTASVFKPTDRNPVGLWDNLFLGYIYVDSTGSGDTIQTSCVYKFRAEETD